MGLINNDVTRPCTWKWAYRPSTDEFVAWPVDHDEMPEHSEMIDDFSSWITGRGDDHDVWINRNGNMPGVEQAIQYAQNWLSKTSALHECPRCKNILEYPDGIALCEYCGWRPIAEDDDFNAEEYLMERDFPDFANDQSIPNYRHGNVIEVETMKPSEDSVRQPFTSRRPFIYHQPTDTMYMGIGGTHDAVAYKMPDEIKDRWQRHKSDEEFIQGVYAPAMGDVDGAVNYYEHDNDEGAYWTTGFDLLSKQPEQSHFHRPHQLLQEYHAGERAPDVDPDLWANSRVVATSQSYKFLYDGPEEQLHIWPIDAHTEDPHHYQYAYENGLKGAANGGEGFDTDTIAQGWLYAPEYIPIIGDLYRGDGNSFPHPYEEQAKKAVYLWMRQNDIHPDYFDDAYDPAANDVADESMMNDLYGKTATIQPYRWVYDPTADQVYFDTDFYLYQNLEHPSIAYMAGIKDLQYAGYVGYNGDPNHISTNSLYADEQDPVTQHAYDKVRERLSEYKTSARVNQFMWNDGRFQELSLAQQPAHVNLFDGKLYGADAYGWVNDDGSVQYYLGHDVTPEQEEELLTELRSRYGDNNTRIAAAQTMYHVSPQTRRRSIEQHGLDARIQEADHNHLWDSLTAAQRYAPYVMLGYPYDIWAVDTTGYELEQDPMMSTAWPDSDEPLTGAWRTETPFTPNRLTLVGPSNDRGKTYIGVGHETPTISSRQPRTYCPSTIQLLRRSTHSHSTNDLSSHTPHLIVAPINVPNVYSFMAYAGIPATGKPDPHQRSPLGNPLNICEEHLFENDTIHSFSGKRDGYTRWIYDPDTNQTTFFRQKTHNAMAYDLGLEYGNYYGGMAGYDPKDWEMEYYDHRIFRPENQIQSLVMDALTGQLAQIASTWRVSAEDNVQKTTGYDYHRFCVLNDGTVIDGIYDSHLALSYTHRVDNSDIIADGYFNEGTQEPRIFMRYGFDHLKPFATEAVEASLDANPMRHRSPEIRGFHNLSKTADIHIQELQGLGNGNYKKFLYDPNTDTLRWWPTTGHDGMPAHHQVAYVNHLGDPFDYAAGEEINGAVTRITVPKDKIGHLEWGTDDYNNLRDQFESEYATRVRPLLDQAQVTLPPDPQLESWGRGPTSWEPNPFAPGSEFEHEAANPTNPEPEDWTPTVLDREEEHYDALPFVWDNGKVIFGQYGHQDILYSHPEYQQLYSNDEFYPAIPNKWYVGRLFDDGAVLSWDTRHPEIPENIQQQIRDAAKTHKHEGRTSGIHHRFIVMKDGEVLDGFYQSHPELTYAKGVNDDDVIADGFFIEDKTHLWMRPRYKDQYPIAKAALETYTGETLPEQYQLESHNKEAAGERYKWMIDTKGEVYIWTDDTWHSQKAYELGIQMKVGGYIYNQGRVQLVHLEGEDELTQTEINNILVAVYNEAVNMGFDPDNSVEYYYHMHGEPPIDRWGLIRGGQIEWNDDADPMDDFDSWQQSFSSNNSRLNQHKEELIDFNGWVLQDFHQNNIKHKVAQVTFNPLNPPRVVWQDPAAVLQPEGHEGAYDSGWYKFEYNPQDHQVNIWQTDKYAWPHHAQMKFIYDPDRHDYKSFIGHYDADWPWVKGYGQYPIGGDDPYDETWKQAITPFIRDAIQKQPKLAAGENGIHWFENFVFNPGNDDIRYDVWDHNEILYRAGWGINTPAVGGWIFESNSKPRKYYVIFMSVQMGEEVDPSIKQRIIQTLEEDKYPEGITEIPYESWMTDHQINEVNKVVLPYEEV